MPFPDAFQMPCRCLQMLPDAFQMPPDASRCSHMPPDGSRGVQMLPVAPQMLPRCLPYASRNLKKLADACSAFQMPPDQRQLFQRDPNQKVNAHKIHK